MLAFGGFVVWRYWISEVLSTIRMTKNCSSSVLLNATYAVDWWQLFSIISRSPHSHGLQRVTERRPSLPWAWYQKLLRSNRIELLQLRTFVAAFLFSVRSTWDSCRSVSGWGPEILVEKVWQPKPGDDQ